MFPHIPGVEGRSLLRFHGCAFVEVLGKVGLVQARDVHHLPLGDVVLLHVTFDHAGSTPWILAAFKSNTGERFHVTTQKQINWIMSQSEWLCFRGKIQIVNTDFVFYAYN